MISIRTSVGRGGMNFPSDVSTVQELLNRHRPVGLRPIQVDGRIGPETIAAIEEFQRRVVRLARPDGRLDPGGPTLRALTGNPSASTPVARPRTVDELITIIQREFPQSHIRVTGRGRTIRRQAELMSQRRRQNRQQFLQTYRPAPHITEMDQWVANHPRAIEPETVNAFVDIIERAQRNGAAVSNHFSDTARDISIPGGGRQVEAQVQQRIHQLGGRVIDERDAVGGPHWHVDF